jgi:serine/threonine-protein kinase
MRLSVTPDLALPVSELQRIDAACDRFEADWRDGVRPDLESYLSGWTEPARSQLLLDLIGLELHLLIAQGETPDRDNYRQRFPGDDEIIEAAFRTRDKTDRTSLGERPGELLISTQDKPGKNESTVDAPGSGEAVMSPHSWSHASGYEVVSELGRGGMGIVYKARQIALDRMVALKVIRSAEFASEDALLRFQKEAEAVALLDHPHIVPIYQVGHAAGLRFFSMKLIPGSSMDKKLADFSDNPRGAARLLATIAEAVNHAHQRGILHRDLKPANILLDEQGEPHVSDFGLARRIEADSDLTHSGYPLGTPSYMSPEQARGERASLSTATDVYGLGSILYALLTGQAPFTGTSLAETLDKVRGATPEPPGRLNSRVPRDLEIICLKCLEKDPGRRYASASALAADLLRWLGGEPIEARPVGPAMRSWMWCRRNPLPAALAALCGLAILGGLAGVTWKWREAALARDEAQAINDFFNHKLLDQASPRFNPRGASLTVGELLDLTSARLGGEFEGRPAVEATIRKSLGSAYQGLGLYDKARPHFAAAIKLDSQTRGQHDRQTLRDVNLMTSLLDESGRYAEAEPLMRQNLEECTTVLGPDDATTLDAEYQLGVLQYHLQKLDLAETVLGNCLAKQRRVMDSQHPDTLRTINQLGIVLQDRGRLDEADSLALEYEHGIRCLFGTKHPDNVTALASRARVRLNQGRLDEAELLYGRALSEAKRIFGAEHPRSLAAAIDCTRAMQRNGKQADAAQLLREERTSLQASDAERDE